MCVCVSLPACVVFECDSLTDRSLVVFQLVFEALHSQEPRGYVVGWIIAISLLVGILIFLLLAVLLWKVMQHMSTDSSPTKKTSVRKSIRFLVFLVRITVNKMQLSQTCVTCRSPVCDSHQTSAQYTVVQRQLEAREEESLGPLTTVKRTNHRVHYNSHHTTHMKEESKGETAITLMSRGPVSTKLLFFCTASFSTGNTTTKPRNVGPGIRSPPEPRTLPK